MIRLSDSDTVYLVTIARYQFYVLVLHKKKKILCPRATDTSS